MFLSRCSVSDFDSDFGFLDPPARPRGAWALCAPILPPEETKYLSRKSFLVRNVIQDTIPTYVYLTIPPFLKARNHEKSRVKRLLFSFTQKLLAVDKQ